MHVDFTFVLNTKMLRKVRKLQDRIQQATDVNLNFTNPEKYEYNPKNSGFVNRKSSDVTADGNVYCYNADVLEKNQQSLPPGKIIVQMTSETELKIEHLIGSCSESIAFQNPTTYNR